MAFKMNGWSAFTKKTDKVTADIPGNVPASTDTAKQTGTDERAAARRNKREDMKGAPDVATTKPRKQPEAAQDREKTPPHRTAKPMQEDSPAEDKSPMTKKKSPYYIAEEGDIQADMAPINLKAKDNRKKISKHELKIAKLKHGKDSEEYQQAKDKKKKLQTGREKIRTKMQEKKDERTRKKNINKTKRDKIKQTKAEAKFLKDNPDMTNIPMP